MKHLIVGSENISWHLDFSPLRKNPEFLPVFCIQDENLLVALTGFERKTNATINVLILEPVSLPYAMKSLWPLESLRPHEEQRFNKVIGDRVHSEYLLSWPIDFQNLMDSRQMPLKNLRPLEHLKMWQKEIAEIFLKLDPSSSQIRELLDLICDLRFLGHSWNEIALSTSEPSSWLGHLKKLRTPAAVQRDDLAAQAVRNLPWPRGTQAKWERQGDQTGLFIQSRISTPLEWKKLQEAISRLEIGESIWN